MRNTRTRYPTSNTNKAWAPLSSSSGLSEKLSKVWAVATLVSPVGEVIDEQLGGRIADSAYPVGEGTCGSG